MGMKILNKLKDAISDKIVFFKLFFYYIFVKNLFVNTFLGFVIFIICHFKITPIIGPFVGAVLTFNLINSYSYFIKMKNWNKVKTIIMGDTLLFAVKYIMILRTNRIPLYEKRTTKYEKLDELLNFVIPETVNDFNEVLEIYEKYFFELLKSKDIELEYNKQYMDVYKEFFKGHINRLYQNATMTTVLFMENQKLISHLSEFLKAVNHNMELNVVEENDINKKIIITQVLLLIVNLKNILKFIL